MAVRARFYHGDGFVSIDIYPDERRLKVGEAPRIAGYDPGQRLWFYWDDDKLTDNDEYEFVMVEVNNIRNLLDEDLDALDTINTPRIDVPEINLYDVSMSDVLRWARDAYPGRPSVLVSQAAARDAESAHQ